MIRKHWIVRYRPPETAQSIREVVDEVGNYDYESVLFTVHPMLSDMWTKLAASVNPNHTFKYMIAFRPYLFSPQYLAMLISSFNDISNNRLMLNLVHGTYAQRETFSSIMNGEALLDKQYKKQYAKDFMNKFFNDAEMFIPYDMPEILVSGSSDDSIELAKNTSNTIGMFYESFIENPERYTSQGFKKIFVFLSVLIRETDEAAELEVASIPEENRTINGCPIYGSKETVAKKIIELSNLGVTDIFFSQFDQWHDTKEIHQFLTELADAGILR
jgi:alkanesulfonate monooxygenase SsuD/methylene tetrahydromethanopterin reductase-like flavin-dependent oxidoreductase (luciferase family)